MNWIGGAKNRVKLHGDQRLQKEFFEKKKLDLKCEKILKQSVCKTPATRKKHLSQDLLALHTVSKASVVGIKSRQNSVKEVKFDERQSHNAIRILDKVNHGNIVRATAKRFNRVELPFSPTPIPSKIDLLEFEPSCSIPSTSSRPLLKQQHIFDFITDCLNEGGTSKNYNQHPEMDIPQHLPSRGQAVKNQKLTQFASSSLLIENQQKKHAVKCLSKDERFWIPEDFQKSPSDVTHCQDQLDTADDFSLSGSNFFSQKYAPACFQLRKDETRFTSKPPTSSVVQSTDQFYDTIMFSHREIERENKISTPVFENSILDNKLNRTVNPSSSWPLHLEAVYDKLTPKEEAASTDDFKFSMRPLFENKSAIWKPFPAVCNEDKSSYRLCNAVDDQCLSRSSTVTNSSTTGHHYVNLEDIFIHQTSYPKLETSNKLYLVTNSSAARNDQVDLGELCLPHSACLHELSSSASQTYMFGQSSDIKRGSLKLSHQSLNLNAFLDTEVSREWSAKDNQHGVDVLLELGELEKDTLFDNSVKDTGCATMTQYSPQSPEGADVTSAQEEACKGSVKITSDVENAVQEAVEEMVHHVVLFESQSILKDSVSFGHKDSNVPSFSDSHFTSECKSLQTIRGGDEKTTVSVHVQTDWSLMGFQTNHMPDLCSKQFTDRGVQWEPPSPQTDRKQELLASADTMQTSEAEFTETNDCKKSTDVCSSTVESENSSQKSCTHYSLRSKSRNR